MKAAVLHAPGELSVEDVPTPSPGPGDLLIRVRAASICGTDLRIYRHGHFKLPRGVPRVLGHEVAGDIVAVGGDVAGYTLGQRVSVTPNVGCGRCAACLRGLNNMCPDYEAFGITLDGAFAEYLLVPGFAVARGNVFHLPKPMSYLEAALTEPFSCCFRGQRAVDVSFGDSVVIIGAGPIGIFHTMLARVAGAAQIIVANSSQHRLEVAKRYGADRTVDVSTTSLADSVRAATRGRGADVVIVTASVASAQTEAVHLLAAHGRMNVFAGVGGGGTAELDTNRVHYGELTVTGTTGSSNSDYTASLDLVSEGRVSLAGLVSATFPLGRIADAFAHSAGRLGMKAAFVADDDISDDNPDH